jgi:hypothetical protein
MSYLPLPPRVWSRVQSACTFLNPNDNYNTSGYGLTLAQAEYKKKLLYKGNILQYKGNSAQLTKKQRYTQLSKGYGPSRTKVFATQSETYSNPNTTGLLRVGGITIPYPNYIVGQPNNPSGPYQPDVPNPDKCNNDGSLLDGGTLICGTFVNPCSNEIVSILRKKGDLICNSSSASDVPGRPIALCWDPGMQSWFPKQRYVMNNSTDKWPDNYKGLVSAIRPEPPVIELNGLVLSWTFINSCLVPVSSFRIYVNGRFTTEVNNTNSSSQVMTFTFTELQANDTIYMTSVSTSIESLPSNIVLYI